MDGQIGRLIDRQIDIDGEKDIETVRERLRETEKDRERWRSREEERALNKNDHYEICLHSERNQSQDRYIQKKEKNKGKKQ